MCAKKTKTRSDPKAVAEIKNTTGQQAFDARPEPITFRRSVSHLPEERPLSTDFMESAEQYQGPWVEVIDPESGWPVKKKQHTHTKKFPMSISHFKIKCVDSKKKTKNKKKTAREPCHMFSSCKKSKPLLVPKK